MRRNLDIATLRSLIAIAETGGVTRAAERLRLTQSAVSMQIKRLEETMGVALLDRSRRGVSPTAEGEQLLGFARRMVTLNDEAVDRMISPAFEGEVSFGVPVDLVYPHAPTILRRFNADFPRVNVRFINSYTVNLLEDFRAGRLDVIITTEDHSDPAAETITEIPLRWYGAKGGRAWAQRPLPFGSARQCAFRPGAVAALERAGIPWRMGVETGSEGAAVAAASADLCIMTLLDGGYPERLEAVNHGGKLPELPTFAVNLYCAKDSANAELAVELSRYVREAFSSA